ncbi:unnamed protein product [Musa acuminata subsp. burmannicoides]
MIYPIKIERERTVDSGRISFSVAHVGNRSFLCLFFLGSCLRSRGKGDGFGPERRNPRFRISFSIAHVGNRSFLCLFFLDSCLRLRGRAADLGTERRNPKFDIIV